MALMFQESAACSAMINVFHVRAQQISARLAAQTALSTSFTAINVRIRVHKARVTTLVSALNVNFLVRSVLQGLRSALRAPKKMV